MLSSLRNSASGTLVTDAHGEATARRAVAVMALVGVALVHVIDFPGKVQNAPFVGILYIPLVIVTLVLAEMLIRFDDLRLWVVSGVVSAATIIGFTLSRTIGLPTEGGHEIGKWTGDLALSSLVVEALVVWLAWSRWKLRNRQ